MSEDKQVPTSIGDPGGGRCRGHRSGGRPATSASAAEALTYSPAPLWRTARNNDLAYGTAWATWMADRALIRLQDPEAAILLTQDDLLWYVLKPTPESKLDFSYGNAFYRQAESQNQLVLGAHLVWDEGFGDGWTDDDLWGLNRRQASDLLFGVVRSEVKHYKGRTSAWIVANEVTDPKGNNGFRTNVPWYNTISPSYIAEAFHLAHDTDPSAELILNEFGFETTNKYGDEPWRRRCTSRSTRRTASHCGTSTVASARRRRSVRAGARDLPRQRHR